MTEEVKRVAFTTIGSVSAFGTSSSSAMVAGQKSSTSGAVNESPSTKKNKAKSFRIDVDLSEPTADSFPEFNFRLLLNLEKVQSQS